MAETTRTTTRYWVVTKEPTLTKFYKTEGEARAKANQMMCSAIDVLRIERQVTTTTTSALDF